MTIDRTRPFLLLDDARPGGIGLRLFDDCTEMVVADLPEQMSAVLDAVDRIAAGGGHAGGFIAYEAGHAIEPALAGIDRVQGDLPLAWFGAFARSRCVATETLGDPAGAWIGAAVPRPSEAHYRDRFARVQALIEAGDIYQANLTFPADVTILGDPVAAFAALRPRGGAGHGALLWTGTDWLISLSPERFFAVDGRTIRVRPMKGTAPRAADRTEDERLAAALSSDAKQRAENLMIVDLMRNDLSRIAEPGSVTVPALFEVEPYPTVHQMVSRVEARLPPGTTAGDVLRAIFPCGSVTGAPKIRAMQVIADVEPEPRGAYTGAIGVVAPSGDAEFNVAIRTIRLKAGETQGTIGLGSGIVADSNAGDEWAECLTKAAFLTAGQRAFDLIETMAFDPRSGIALIERHLERMKTSARTFGFAFDRHAARNELQAATFRLRDAARVRLLLAPSGAIAIEIGAMPATPDGPVDVALVPLPVDAADFRLRHKTTDRGFYDAARKAAGTFEVAFALADGSLTEGSFTSLFVELPDGRLATPPIGEGLLPGVLRSELIESGRAVERRLSSSDLATGFFVGNALRGLIRARLVAEIPTGG